MYIYYIYKYINIYKFTGSCRPPPSNVNRWSRSLSLFSLSQSVSDTDTHVQKQDTTTVPTSKLTTFHASLCKNTCSFWPCFTEQSEWLVWFSFTRRAAPSYKLSIIQLNKTGDGAREISYNKQLITF